MQTASILKDNKWDFCTGVTEIQSYPFLQDLYEFISVYSLQVLQGLLKKYFSRKASVHKIFNYLHIGIDSQAI